MNILMIDTSGPACGVAIMADGRLVYEAELTHKQTHSQRVMPMVDTALQMSDMTAADMDVFGAVVGPGSFTGVRIGVATVKGLALGTDRPCVGVSTLEAMAWGARSLGGSLCCVMDARAGQVYNALFEVDGLMPRRLCDDRALKMTELSEEIGEAPYFLVGDGANLCYNTIKDSCTGLRLAPPELRYATGFGVAAAALPLIREGRTCTPQELDAFYLRRPQAERERMKRLAENK